MGQKPADIPEDALRTLYAQGLSQKRIALILGCGQSAVWRRMRKLGIPTRNKSENSLRVSQHETLRHDFDGTPQMKAYMLGFCKGDIHAWKRGENSETIRLMSSTTRPEQVELFRTIFRPYGHVYVSNPDKVGALHMAAYVNLSMSFLLDKEDSIPGWIMESSDLFFAFFAGYVDAEAHIGVYNNAAVFKIDTYQKNILLQSYVMFCKVGMQGPEPYVCTKQGYANKHGYRYRHDLWRLKVGAKSSLLILFELLRPYLMHKDRIRQMEAAIINIESRNLKMAAKKNARKMLDECD